MVRYVVSGNQKMHVCEIMDMVNDLMQYGEPEKKSDGKPDKKSDGKSVRKRMHRQYQNHRQAARPSASLHLAKRIIAKIIARWMQ